MPNINRRIFLKALGLSLIAPEMLFSADKPSPSTLLGKPIVNVEGMPDMPIVLGDFSTYSGRYPVEFILDGKYFDTGLNNFPIYIKVPHVGANGVTKGHVYFDTGAKRLSPRIGTITWKEIEP